MKINFNPIKVAVGCLAAASLVCLPMASQAGSVTLALDSANSYLNASGNAFTLNFGPQGGNPLAMRAYYSGLINADLTGGVFTFTGGSSIAALLNPLGPFSSAPWPGGPWPGNYGVTAGPTLVVPYGLVTVNGTYGGMTLDLTAGTAENGFAPAGMNDKWTAGLLTWGASTGLGPFGGTSAMAGVAGANTSAALASWDGTTLMLPIQFHTVGSNRYEDWSGQLVAVLVPEPTTLALAVVGLGFLAARARRS